MIVGYEIFTDEDRKRMLENSILLRTVEIRPSDGSYVLTRIEEVEQE